MYLAAVLSDMYCPAPEYSGISGTQKCSSSAIFSAIPLTFLFPRLCQLVHQGHERHVDGLMYCRREWISIIGQQFAHQRGVIAESHAGLR